MSCGIDRHHVFTQNGNPKMGERSAAEFVQDLKLWEHGTEANDASLQILAMNRSLQKLNQQIPAKLEELVRLEGALVKRTHQKHVNHQTAEVELHQKHLAKPHGFSIAKNPKRVTANKHTHPTFHHL